MVDKKIIKRGCISIGAILVLMLATPFMGSAIIGVQTADQIYKTVEEIPKKELGLVLGAAAYPSRLSDVLKDRVDTAIELYNAQKISTLVMSGSPAEAEAMKEYALEEGVPETAITEDAAGLNTMASIKNIVALNRPVTIISQQFHLPRALFIANTMGIDAIGMTADKHEYVKIDEFKSRELLATSKAILDIFILD
jgi:SanA protein